MTKAELIEELDGLPDDTIVYIPCMDSYGYFDCIMRVEIESDGSDGREPKVSLIPYSWAYPRNGLS